MELCALSATNQRHPFNDFCGIDTLIATKMKASILHAVAWAASIASAAKETPSSTTHVPACTATSSTNTGAFFDLRPDIAHQEEKGKHKAGMTKDYHSRGYDYGKNFTLNICGSVVDPVSDVIGVDKNKWANVSAYYTSHGSVYSIGSESMDLVSRGRMLVLRYTGGSPCGPKKSNKSTRSPAPRSGAWNHGADDAISVSHQPHEIETFAKDDDDEDETRQMRKSATINFLCDRDVASTQASISFVGTDPDECAYYFQARSIHACAHAEPHKPGSVGPGSVFGLILVIAFLVYALGGIFYNRTVANARGWRQLPNYSLWAGIWSFFSVSHH